MAGNEYIERSAIIKEICGLTAETWGKGLKNGWWSHSVQIKDNFLRVINKLPAADVAPVVHGEWIIKIDYKTPVSHAHIRKEKLYICPYCGKDYRQHMNFCGNCGAKMDGERKEATP